MRQISSKTCNEVNVERNRIARYFLYRLLSDLAEDEGTYVNKEPIIVRLNDALISLGGQPCPIPKKKTPDSA